MEYVASLRAFALSNPVAVAALAISACFLWNAIRIARKAVR